MDERISSVIKDLITQGWNFAKENVDSATLTNPNNSDRVVLQKDEDQIWQLNDQKSVAEG
jgi:hypothetical protein